MPHCGSTLLSSSGKAVRCYTHSFVSELRRYVLLSFFLLTACTNIPDSYAPPVQRESLTGAKENALGRFIQMNDPNVDAYIVRDVSEATEGSWRWARKRPELRFFLASIENLKFQADFAVARATLQETGPVTVSIFINGNLLDKVHCADDTEKHFLKAVPTAFLRANAINFVALEVDKVYIAKADGAVLGFILSRAGFPE